MLSKNSLIVQILDSENSDLRYISSSMHCFEEHRCVIQAYQCWPSCSLSFYVWQAMNADAIFGLIDLGYSGLHQQAVTGFVLLA